MDTSTTYGHRRNNVNALLAKILGGVLVLVGLLGFIPGITNDGALLGIFGVNALHNIVHLLTGGILLWAGLANDGQNARRTNQILGVVYALVAILSFTTLTDALLGENASNPAFADAALHVLIAGALLAVGFGVRDETTSPAARPGSP